MRKKKREITDPSVIAAMLDACHVGRLGTVSPEGQPMIKPLNFVYYEGRIYFHSALEGEKLEHIRHEPRVCFEVDLPVALLKARVHPCDCKYLYRSVIIKGLAAVVLDDAERINALDALTRKYHGNESVGGYTAERLAITAVVRIDVVEITGKEDLDKGRYREDALRALEDGTVLPVILKRD